MIFSDRFISAGSKFCTYDEHVGAPEFRRTFVLNDFRRAELTICGLGFYELGVNGVCITKGRLAPYISNPDEIIVQSENAMSEKFESTSGTKIASDSAVVELAYQGETEKDGSLAKYITDNYQNFTVNVLTAVASGQHASSGSGFVISTDG